MKAQGIDADEARDAEHITMMADARDWLLHTNLEAVNYRHPVTGASALHVAAAKSYIDVMQLLLKVKRIYFF